MNTRAPQHRHTTSRMCVVCANVTMHDIQCKSPEGKCRVSHCRKNPSNKGDQK